jgi:hypothetical protein
MLIALKLMLKLMLFLVSPDIFKSCKQFDVVVLGLPLLNQHHVLDG